MSIKIVFSETIREENKDIPTSIVLKPGCDGKHDSNSLGTISALIKHFDLKGTSPLGFRLVGADGPQDCKEIESIDTDSNLVLEKNDPKKGADLYVDLEKGSVVWLLFHAGCPDGIVSMRLMKEWFEWLGFIVITQGVGHRSQQNNIDKVRFLQYKDPIAAVVGVDVSFKALDAVFVLMRSDFQGQNIEYLDFFDHHNSIVPDMESFRQKAMTFAQTMVMDPTKATAWLEKNKPEVRCMSVDQSPLCAVSLAKRCTGTKKPKQTEDILCCVEAIDFYANISTLTQCQRDMLFPTWAWLQPGGPGSCSEEKVNSLIGGTEEETAECMKQGAESADRLRIGADTSFASLKVAVDDDDKVRTYVGTLESAQPYQLQELVDTLPKDKPALVCWKLMGARGPAWKFNRCGGDKVQNPNCSAVARLALKGGGAVFAAGASRNPDEEEKELAAAHKVSCETFVEEDVAAPIKRRKSMPTRCITRQRTVSSTRLRQCRT